MENQTVGISFCPNSGRGVKKPLKLSDIAGQAHSCCPELQGRSSASSVCIMLTSFTRPHGAPRCGDNSV